MIIIKKIKKIYHFVLAWLGNIFYGFPSKNVFLLGVTGTKGKSTTLEIINHLFENAGYKTALLSSVRIKIDKDSEKNNLGNSMPGRFFIKKFLKRAAKKGCQYAFVEVTSEGVVQHRHRFLDWDGALFTNLKPEHIEAHGSFEKYRQAKVSFFSYLKKSSKDPIYFFLNKEDENVTYFEKVIENFRKAKIFYFGLKNFKNSNFYQELKNSLKDSWLNTDFNLENTAAAFVFAKSRGLDEETIKRGLLTFTGLWGRFDFVKKEPFGVVIDYAHTPDSLEKIYQAVKSKGYENLICVFGSCGGGRDKWKRPVMGEIASRYCRTIILTNEDPYDEDEEAILNDIEKGIKANPNFKGEVFKIFDRKEAIKKAFKTVLEKEAVVITGKGSESFIHMAKGKKINWHEKEVVVDCLKELNL